MSQQKASKQNAEQSILFPGGSPVNHTASPAYEKQAKMRETYGENTLESFAKLSPDGLWLKTYQGCFQATMDGSFQEFCEIWPATGIVLNGTAFQLRPLVQHISEIESFCWLSTPTASMTVPSKQTRDSNRLPSPAECTGQYYERSGKLIPVPGGQQSPQKIGNTSIVNPEWIECLMGLPIGYTDLDV